MFRSCFGKNPSTDKQIQRKVERLIDEYASEGHINTSFSNIEKSDIPKILTRIESQKRMYLREMAKIEVTVSADYDCSEKKHASQALHRYSIRLTYDPQAKPENVAFTRKASKPLDNFLKQTEDYIKYRDKSFNMEKILELIKTKNSSTQTSKPSRR